MRSGVLGWRFYGRMRILCNMVVMAFLIILPDVLFSLLDDGFKLSHDIKGLFLLAPLSFGLLLNRVKGLSYFLLSVFCIVQLMQFSSLAYFRNFLSPFSIYLFTKEFHDTFQEGLNVFPKYWYILPMVTLPFIGMAYIIKKSSKKSWIATLVLLFTVGLYGVKYFVQTRPAFNPNGIRFTIDNSLKALGGYAYVKMHHENIETYKPYEVIDLLNGKELFQDGDEPINIVYIIGESANFRHMSLFGYERDTTPRLKKLAERNDVCYTKGISGGISTVASTKFMLNCLREANNPVQASDDATNLFRLAKQRGFKTFYISNQGDNLLASISGVNYMDVIETRAWKRCDMGDDVLMDTLNKQTFAKKNFIVLHQRCVHSPYLKSVSNSFKPHERFEGSKNGLIDDYDNAMLYNDSVICNLFNYFNKRGKYYIFWASDHNELLGERGIFGHGIGNLYPEVADIPIIVQSNDERYISWFKNLFSPNHYDIAKSIARILGYDVRNPNEDGLVYYISGVDFNGQCGFLQYNRYSDSRVLEYIE